MTNGSNETAQVSEEGLKYARRRAWFATGLFGLVLIIGLFFWQNTKEIIGQYDAAFKLVGLAIGPFLALMGFVWGRVDKAEMMLLAERLAEERTKAAAATAFADRARDEISRKVSRIEALEHDLATVADAGRLWKLRENAPFIEYRGWKHDPRGAKIVTVGLFKGGVGKTHLAANFAAYVSERKQKPVLLVDLDFQGSLSTAVLRSAGFDENPGSLVDELFDERANLATLVRSRVQLAAQGERTALNRGNGLARAWIVPADYTLAKTESELLVKRVIHNAAGLDERYRLAHVLLHPEVRREFSLIIIDTPPRMTLGTVNALVASHNYIVPIIPDRVSSEAVRPYLVQVEQMKKDLDLELSLAGIVASMTYRSGGLTDRENAHWTKIYESAHEVLGVGPEVCLDTNIPDKVDIRDSGDLGYFLSDANGSLRSRIYDPLFDELWTRIMRPHESA